MSQLLLDISPEKRPTLDNFVVGRNIELVSALRHSLLGGTERCFYLWGETGSGKSHLLLACVSAAIGLGQTAVYCEGAVPQCAGVVAVDDVEQLDELQQISLFNVYNQIRESGGMLLVSGDKPALQLSLRDDLRTRLAWGLVYQVHSLSDEEKAMALSRHAQQKGYALSMEVVQYLLRHGRRDIPSLMSVLDALDRHSLRLHRAPSVPLLKEVLRMESK
jgi:DnaA family protein